MQVICCMKYRQADACMSSGSRCWISGEPTSGLPRLRAGFQRGKTPGPDPVLLWSTGRTDDSHDYRLLTGRVLPHDVRGTKAKMDPVMHELLAGFH